LVRKIFKEDKRMKLMLFHYIKIRAGFEIKKDITKIILVMKFI